MTDKTQETTDREPQRYEVTLIKPHTHGGEELQPGAKIRVTADQRNWLREAEVIEEAKPTADVSKEK